MQVLLRGGPADGIAADVSEGAWSLQVPVANPALEFLDPWETRKRRVPHPRFEGAWIIELKNDATGEWEEVPQFLAAAYRRIEETAIGGTPIFHHDSGPN